LGWGRGQKERGEGEGGEVEGRGGKGRPTKLLLNQDPSEPCYATVYVDPFSALTLMVAAPARASGHYSRISNPKSSPLKAVGGPA